MMLRLPRQLPVIAAAAGTLAALLVAILPEWRLVVLVEGLGLPSILSAARPPLGMTARLLLALAIGALAGGGAFVALRMALRLVPTAREDGVPVLRRADAHPDAPARRPIRAMEDLGDPLPMRTRAILKPASDDAERTLPADLDTPLAAMDPGAILAAPQEPVRPVAPLARPAKMAEDAFELVPIRRATKVREREPMPATVAGLIERLERGAAKGARPQPSAEGLGALRGLAVR
jgi:hypothetical protein